MKDSGHYYHLDGTSCHALPNKSKPGTTRPTTIRDAKTLGLLPSVTTIMGVLAKPALDDWKHRQITGWCYENHAEHGLIDAEAYHARAMEGAFQQVSDAADLGTDIHAAIEAHYQGKPYAPALAVYVEAVDKWANENFVTFEKHELRLVNKAHGYAGTTDAVISCPRGRGILDFKSRKTKPGQPATPYDGQPMQIAAYDEAYFWNKLEARASRTGVNVFISTTEPGRVEATWYDGAQLAREWEAFQAVLLLYRHMKGFDPRIR